MYIHLQYDNIANIISNPSVNLYYLSVFENLQGSCLKQFIWIKKKGN